MHPTPYSRDNHFYFPIRVYYEDTDAAGVVYYANYLKFAERARTEWLRSIGIEQDAMLRDDGLGFVVARAEVTYKRPARLDDVVWVETHLQQLSKVRMSMRQILRVGDVVCSEIDVDVACVDRSFALAKLSDALHRTFSAFLS
ncbi:MAG: tol-pal system-associated acyl-CoA thioesterase [Alphaproteobacteria bacterium]|nr:tol-pal system-associated acyl-CoA thioesterase [Alphaproteobacteria bacterium]